MDGDERLDHGASGRDETETERLDRNWASLLQELRVVQTGGQLLTGFLLTLPFQQRFDDLDPEMRTVYLVTVTAAIFSTCLLIAPVAIHRLLFRRRRLAVLVAAAHQLAVIGLLLLSVAMAGMATLIFDAVAGRRAALMAGGVAVVVFAVFWFVLPLTLRVVKARPSAPERPRSPH